jgi:hypothetical protein
MEISRQYRVPSALPVVSVVQLSASQVCVAGAVGGVILCALWTSVSIRNMLRQKAFGTVAVNLHGEGLGWIPWLGSRMLAVTAGVSWRLLAAMPWWLLGGFSCCSGMKPDSGWIAYWVARVVAD